MLCKGGNGLSPGNPQDCFNPTACRLTGIKLKVALAQVFNFKLCCFIAMHELHGLLSRGHLELKTQHNLPKFFFLSTGVSGG
jgi:hypothetical protein